MDNADLDEIINSLTEAENTLATPLLKTKVLAHRIKNAKLLDWVSNEIDGYSNDDSVPEYRQCRGVLVGTYLNGTTQVNNQPIPKGRYLKEIDIEQVKFRQSIMSLESLISDSDKSKEIGIEHNAEVISIIQQGIREQGNEFFGLVNARTRITRSAVIGILAKVRNSLLDLILKLDEKFTSVDELRDQPHKVEEIMNQTIIHAGAGSIINTGDHNKISSANVVTTGDKNSLSKHLSDNGIPQDYINQLLEVVDDGYEEAESWMWRTLKKVKDGTWNIKISAAGSLLADAIKAYFGMS